MQLLSRWARAGMPRRCAHCQELFQDEAYERLGRYFCSALCRDEDTRELNPEMTVRGVA